MDEGNPASYHLIMLPRQYTAGSICRLELKSTMVYVIEVCKKRKENSIPVELTIQQYHQLGHQGHQHLSSSIY